MAETKKNPLGITGRTVADNIAKLRSDMPYTKLAARLAEIGRPIPTLGLRKIESYERRVDADDLVALAAVLGVSPITLLMPRKDNAEDQVSILDDANVSAGMLWHWLRAYRNIPLVPGVSYSEFVNRALPPWELAKLEQQWLADRTSTPDELVDEQVRDILKDQHGDD